MTATINMLLVKLWHLYFQGKLRFSLIIFFSNFNVMPNPAKQVFKKYQFIFSSGVKPSHSLVLKSIWIMCIFLHSRD